MHQPKPTRRVALAIIGSGLAGIATAASNTADPWKDSDLLRPKDLVAAIASTQDRPLILHVGFPVLFRGAHIPGSIYAGEGSKFTAPTGDSARLTAALAGVAHNREIVIYCGCCPWQNCPNVRPAFSAIKTLGYSRVKVLTIPNNLHTDWVEKGYPVEKG